VAPTGTAIGSGDALYSIEGAPVIAMYGDLPAWRSLSTDSEDGVDVLQLESNLRALGFDRDAEMTIDQTFDSDTTAAVERWQAAIGVDVTGEVALGAVVFVPAATAVTSTLHAVGDELGDGDTVVTLAGTTQQIVITVPAADQPYVEPGIAVSVADTAATVVALRSAESNGTVTVQAVIVPGEPLDVADGSAVKVRLMIEKAAGVLLVPAEALVSRLDGTYSVQTSAVAGDHEFVTVELLGVSNGMAGIRGDGLADGASVWVPL
jgi:peptidoglycan hydrolase-like protein with peptidoglycan-binding domain